MRGDLLFSATTAALILLGWWRWLAAVKVVSTSLGC